ncbi:MAG: hypothetical protein WC498_03325 [Candidatus Saccharimonadales bacterium]
MRYFLGILIGLGLVVLVIVLIVKSLGSGKHEVLRQIDLPSYAGTNAVAQLVIDAPINADQTHRTVKISVSQSQTEIDIIQGYQGNVVNSQTFPNSQPGFAVFLKALQNYGFNKGNSDPTKGDERGVCAIGDRYIYSLTSGGGTVMRYWSTSCGGQGTFGGRADVIRRLFLRQIPEQQLTQLTGNIPLGG